ncbi:MAG: cation efflux protein [Chloroflexi bacterium]|nr:cation efflux protein [Chloroflexota bacterium]
MAWILAGLTVIWNAAEAVVGIVSGLTARSIALLAFAFDSVVEVSSAIVIGWLLWRQRVAPEDAERAEQRAVRLIALSFVGIAIVITYESTTQLLGISDQAERSPVGLLLVTASLLVMPALATAKRWVAGRLGSTAMRADAAETQLCTYLSAVVLVGLIANAVAGWWWMDPLAGLGVAVLALREGYRTWISGDLCDDVTIPVAVARLRCEESCCPTCPVAA